MIEYTAPFYLIGEGGKALDATPRLLEDLGICDAALYLASLDIDTLTFRIPGFMVSQMIDNEQMVTLRDSATPTPRVLFKGTVIRSWSMKADIFSFRCENAWKQLSNAPLKGDTNTRPWRTYPEQSVATTLASLVGLAAADGLDVATPGAWPSFYAAPKMTLKSRSYAESIAQVLQMVPDAGTRMDYSTGTPRLYFTRRAPARVIDLDEDDHGVDDATLTPRVDRRALGVTIHYAARTSHTEATLATQVGGNPTAEASRQISLMLSGFERTDSFAMESLKASIQAYNEAAGAISAEGAAIDALAATAAINVFPQWEVLREIDQAVKSALNVAAFTMSRVGGSTLSFYTYYFRYPGEGMPPYDMVVPTEPAVIRLANGNQPVGLYTIKPNTFTDAHLTTAGATKTTVYLRGEFLGISYGSGFNAGLAALKSAQSSKVREFAGYSTYQTSASQGGGQSPNNLQRYYIYKPDLVLTAINKTPAQVAAAVKAQLGTDLEELGEAAAFVTPPDGFAENYFQAQNWTPLTGVITFLPDAPWKPAVGDRVQFTGTRVDPLWAEAEAPISSVEIDLHTGVLTAQAGFPARQEINSLLDAIRFAPEDNLEEPAA